MRGTLRQGGSSGRAYLFLRTASWGCCYGESILYGSLPPHVDMDLGHQLANEVSLLGRSRGHAFDEPLIK